MHGLIALDTMKIYLIKPQRKWVLGFITMQKVNSEIIGFLSRESNKKYSPETNFFKPK